MRRMGMRFPWWSALGAYTAYTLSLVDRRVVARELFEALLSHTTASGMLIDDLDY